MPTTPTYPADHQPGMRVPKGGSSCASCEYLGSDRATCTNTYFIKWRGGSGKLPAPPDQYCSDWYEEKESDTSRSPHGFPSLRSLRREAGEDDK